MAIDPMHNPVQDLLMRHLQAYFPSDEVECRVGPTGGDDGNGNPEVAMPLFYIPARRVQQRLDNVVGPANWQVSYQEPVNRSPESKYGVEAEISVRSMEGGWVSKADVSQNTETEPMKGGYSKAIVRAGVQWGIGRYLYFLPEMGWEEVEQEYGRTTFKNDPQIPSQYTPAQQNLRFSQEQTRKLRVAAQGKDKAKVKEVYDESKGFEQLLEDIDSL